MQCFYFSPEKPSAMLEKQPSSEGTKRKRKPSEKSVAQTEDKTLKGQPTAAKRQRKTPSTVKTSDKHDTSPKPGSKAWKGSLKVTSNFRIHIFGSPHTPC